MREEIDAIERNVLGRVEPRREQAMVISLGVCALLIALLLPWVGSHTGWQLLINQSGAADDAGILPRLFASTAFGAGVLLSVLSLGVRRWVLVWACTVGCGFSTLNGLWAIWFRQSTTGPGPNVGMVLAALTMVVIAIQWVRVTLSRE